MRCVFGRETYAKGGTGSSDSILPSSSVAAGETCLLRMTDHAGGDRKTVAGSGYRTSGRFRKSGGSSVDLHHPALRGAVKYY